jgi:hypothetical protein
MAETKITDKEAAAMREKLAKYDAEKAAEREAARIEALKPVIAFTETDAFKEVAEKIGELADSAKDTQAYPHLNCIRVGVANLPAAITEANPTTQTDPTPPTS